VGAAALAATVLAAAVPAAAVPAAAMPAAAMPAAAMPAAAMPAAAAGGAGITTFWNHVAAGASHTCGIRFGNTLWCWGLNDHGQLGDGNRTDQDLPQQLTRPFTAGWTSVTAGFFHGCALRNDGTLWCWGDNDSGQLGIGSNVSQTRPQQVTTPAPAGWASVAAGDFHTCATRSDGTLWCWGMNVVGELGIGSTTGQSLPQQVTTPAASGWASVATGAEDTCATRTDGTLWCWGFNGYGELGIGNLTDQDLPQQLTTPAASGWASVATGTTHTCATRTDGTLWCWGFNDAGQLGIGSKTEQDLPQQVTTPAPAGWTSVATGGSHTCALRGHGLWCWGFNRYGQLGIGSTVNQSRPRPVPIHGTTGWSVFALGYLHTCALHAGPALWCWGYNANGQLGLGNMINQDLPQQVTS
jgi:alpha-tubulin suppressor-like RCC1 family protein